MRKRFWLVGVLSALACGCVEREMTITSDPEGALVIVSDREKGRTPITFPFTWYGDYDIILRLEGHQTVKTHEQISPPWYEYPPIDLLSQLAPWTYHDRRFLHYKLEKLKLPTDQELIKRAKELEERNREPIRR